MLVYISSVDFDLTGYAALNPLSGSDFGSMIRRANKVKTLDGSVVVNDYGYSSGDLVFKIRVNPDPLTDAALRYFIEYHQIVNVSTDTGFYTAIPLSYEPNGVDSVFELSITGRIA